MAKRRRRLARMLLRYKSRYLSFRSLLIAAVVLAMVFIYKYNSNQKVATNVSEGEDDIDKLMGEVVRKLNLQKPAISEYCPIPHLDSKQPSTESQNVSCQRIQPIRGSCQLANELFLSAPKESCDHQEYQTICEYEESHNTIKCYNDVCDPEKPVSIATTNPDSGTLHWRDLPSIASLQTFIKNLINPTSRQHHYGFMFIKCPKLRVDDDDDAVGDDDAEDEADYEYKDDEAEEDDMLLAGKGHLLGKNANQLLILPPKIFNHKAVHTNKYIDINVVMLDSISRNHFFRSLPKTVKTMNEINEGNASLVLDFELLQSMKGRTYENLLTFFAGEVYEVEKPFGTLDLPPKPLKTEAMLDQFKKHGYHTTWFEDLCWTWEWGLVKDLLALYRDLEIGDRWKKFKHALQVAKIDRYDVTLASCEILRVNNHHDPFHGPDTVCYHGRHQHEYILEYMKYFHNTMARLKQPYFNHILLNTAHEGTGRRVQTLDDSLAEYVKFLTKQENTLTIMYADHGNTYGEFIEKTEEGRIELFNPFMFIIVPKKVAEMLGHEKMAALEDNQHKLVTMLDLHYTVKSLVPHVAPKIDKAHKEYDVQPSGLFMRTPADRTCKTIPRIHPNLCICQGFDSKVKNDTNHALLAEFALGQLNNAIQDEFTASHSSTKRGFGSCRRLVATRFGNVKESHQEDNVVITKMDIYIPAGENSGNTEDVFFVTVQSSMDQGDGMKLLSYQRMSAFSHYGKCADDGVNLNLCVCSLKKTKQHAGNKAAKLQAWNNPPPVFDNNNTVKEVHKKCLYFIERQNNAGGVLEVANVCPNMKYTVVLNMEYSHMIVSRELPAQEVLLPGQIKFMLAMVQTRTHLNWHWNYKASFSWQEV